MAFNKALRYWKWKFGSMSNNSHPSRSTLFWFHRVNNVGDTPALQLYKIITKQLQDGYEELAHIRKSGISRNTFWQFFSNKKDNWLQSGIEKQFHAWKMQDLELYPSSEILNWLQWAISREKTLFDNAHHTYTLTQRWEKGEWRRHIFYNSICQYQLQRWQVPE